MAEGTTLLSYEMAWQLRLFDLATSAQQANDYGMACMYAVGLLKILGLDKELPTRSTPLTKSSDEEIATWRGYYSTLLMVGFTQIRETIVTVRKKYKTESPVPKYDGPVGET